MGNPSTSAGVHAHSLAWGCMRLLSSPDNMKVLRCTFILELVITIVAASTLGDDHTDTAADTVHIRDKRGGVRLEIKQSGTPPGESRLNADGRDVVRLTGIGSVFREIPENLTLRYQNGRIKFVDTESEEPNMEPNITLPNSFSMLSVFRIGSDLEIFRGSSPDIRLPNDVNGLLYYDRDGRAFYTDSMVLEQLRPFPPLIEVITPKPPPELRYVVSRNELVLNIDESPDGRTDIADNRITLTSSTETPLTQVQSFDYISNTIFLRNGPTVFDTIPGISELTILDSDGLQIVSGSPRVRENFGGPGTLYTNGEQGFFTTLSEVEREISEQIIESQFNFSISKNPSSAILFSFLGPSAISNLIELVGAKVTILPTARNIVFVASFMRITDEDDNLLQEFGTFNQFIELSTFLMNEVRQFSTFSRFFMRASSSEGLIVYFNSNTNQVFAFPASNRELRKRIEQALEDAGDSDQQSAQFFFNPDGLGGLSLSGQLGQNRNVTQIGSVADKTFDLRDGEILRYSGNSVRVRRSFIDQAVYDDIDTLVVNHEDNSLDTSMFEAIQTYRGPGRLYIDSVGRRAFYTTNFDLISRVDAYLSSLPAYTPRFECETVYGAKVAQIETPNQQEILVTLSTATTQDVLSNQGVYFFEDQLNTVNVFKVPEQAQVIYNGTRNGMITVLDSQSGTVIFNLFDVTNFLAYLMPGGRIETISGSNVTVPSNGYLYYSNISSSSVLYTINNDINLQIVNTLQSIDAVIETISCPDHFSTYNGRRIQLFTDSAPNVFPGDGTVYSSGCQSFFSTSTRFNMEVPERASELAPISATYDIVSENVVIVNTVGDTIFMFPIGTSENFQVVGGQSIMFMENMIIGLMDKPLTNVNQILYFNGFEVERIFSEAEVIGPGLLIFNPETGEAFFTDDLLTLNIISQRQQNLLESFEAPILLQPTPVGVRSKDREVIARFGQSVQVFDGADVVLQCETSNCNPLNQYEFFLLLDLNNGTVILEPISPLVMSRFNVTVRGNVATLRIDNIGQMENGTLRFQCSVSNPAGDDSIETTVEILPVEPPEIVNTFFPFSAVNERFNSSSGRILTATTDGATDTVIVSNTSAVPSGSQLAPNLNLVTNLVHIGCSADSRPRAEVFWFQDTVMIDVSLPQFDVFEPRQGRSVLTVNYTYLFEQGEMIPVTTMFTCSARNGPNNENVAEASVIVMANEYRCMADDGSSSQPCSVTCGFGVRTRNISCSLNGNPVATDSVPEGLFTAPLELCQSETKPFCPFESFDYTDEDEEFGDCSVTCGTGVERRNISCFVTIDGVLTNDTVDELYCEDLNLRRPKDFRLCFRDDCPFWDITGTFGPCSSTCRGGVRMRQVDCYQNFTDFSSETNFTFGIVNDSFCEELTMPAREQECNRLIPCPFRWHASRWFDECENNCQERNVTCINFEPSDPSEVWPVNDSFCAELRPPHSVRSCGYGVCSRGDWLAGPFSECSVECGFGTYERAVYCTKRGTADTVVMEEGFCDVRFRPAEKERCLVRNCPGRCDYEPVECRQIARLRLCKVPRFRERAEPCCKSCPAQATPIPLLVRTPPTLEAATLAPTDPPMATTMDMGTPPPPPGP